MHAGRPPLGMALLDRLEGTRESRLRLWTICESVVGLITVVEGSERVGVHTSRFHVMRRDVLQAGLDRLVPRTGGRLTQAQEDDGELIRLREENAELRKLLTLAKTETEVAVARSWTGGRRRWR